MSLFSELLERTRTLLFRRREERELAEEIEFHVEMEARQREFAGASPAEARRAALMALGGRDQVKESVRDARGTWLLESFWRDAVLSLRSMIRRREFTLVVLTILALGIGANTTTFTLIDALMLRPLPVPEAERLVTLGDTWRTGSLSVGTPQTQIVSYPLYQDLAGATNVLSGLYASGRTGRLDVRFNSNGAGEPQHPRGRFVSGNYFSVLGVDAPVGRIFTEHDDRVIGGGPVVVVSHAYWQRELGADRSAVGRSITVNDVPLTIVGITPAWFRGDIVGEPTDIWIPLQMQPLLMPHSPWLDDRSVSWLLLMGRLAPGVSLDQARTVLQSVQRRAMLDNAEDRAEIESKLAEGPILVQSGARGFSHYREAFGVALYTLAGAVGLVLLVVCANVANLMLVRAIARNREMSIRVSIGAGRADLMRQLLTESTVLALLAGAIGLLLAHWGSTLVLKLAAGGPNPIPLDARIDGRVLGFTAVLCLGTAMLFGLLPALRATRVDLATALRTQGRGVLGGGRPGRVSLGKLLVVGQIALALVLLVGTGMLVRSVQRMQNQDLGMAREELLIARIDASRAGYEGERLATLTREIRDRLLRVPGVEAVSMSENGLFSGTESHTSINVQNFTASSTEDTLVAGDLVDAGYFEAIGAHILNGRGITEQDAENAPPVTVINETMARFYFPAGDAIGKRISLDGTDYAVVGVVADVKGSGVREEPERRMYRSMAQAGRPGTINIEVRASADPAGLVEPVRQALRAQDALLPILNVSSLTDLVAGSIQGERLVARVISFFGLLALLLTALGLYGVMGYNASRRTNEFGLRIALGAAPSGVLAMMMRETAGLVLLGMAIGIPAALLVGRLLRSQIFGIGLVDLPSMTIAAVVILVSAAVAGSVPARRAANTSPMTALSADLG